jgi:hypothetical protein
MSSPKRLMQPARVPFVATVLSADDVQGKPSQDLAHHIVDQPEVCTQRGRFTVSQL